MFGLFRRIQEVIAPFTVIARELTAIRELYEAELLTREKPVWRVTEKPGRSDTEVTYSDVEEKKKSAMERAKEIVLGLEEDDDDETIG